MRYAAGKQSKLLERFGFATFGVSALARGDVAENEDHARDFVFTIANRRGNLLDDTLDPVARGEGYIFGEIEKNGLGFVSITALLCLRLRGKIDCHVKD